MSRRIRSAKLTEKLARAGLVLAASLALACGSDHRVSPWGGANSPRLDVYLPRADLAARLASIDAEVRPLHLERTAEIEGKLRSGERVVIRGYRGMDAAGRAIHAVRAATARAVVMAAGPLDAGDLDRRAATEIVPALIESASASAYRSGTDLNGDGAPDVVLRSESGALEIWQIGELGTSRYQVSMEADPTAAIDADGDGRIDLAGAVLVDPADPIAPLLFDVAIFEAGRYTNAAASARAWHARRAQRSPAVEKGRDDLRLRAAIERAWHGILSGRARDGALADLDREPVPAALRAAFERHRKRVAAAGK